MSTEAGEVQCLVSRRWVEAGTKRMAAVMSTRSVGRPVGQVMAMVVAPRRSSIRMALDDNGVLCCASFSATNSPVLRPSAGDCHLRHQRLRLQGAAPRRLRSSRIHAAHSLAAALGQVMAMVVMPRRISIRMSAQSWCVGADTDTGTNSLTLTEPGLSRASRRQRCTTLALIPCDSATLTTDAPSGAHCSSTRALNCPL